MSDHSASHDSSTSHADHGDAHSGEHDHGGIGKYLAVFLALCVLTTISFLTFFPFWHNHIPMEVSRALMMAVSCTKAMLVVMFFMHLKWEANWKWVLTVPASFMSVFLMLMLIPDIGWRKDNGYAHYSYERLQYAASPPVVTKQVADAAKKELPEEEPHGAH